MWIKGVLLVIFVVIGLTSASVLEAHILGSGYSGRIETDGFDNGYYLAVWGTSSGINGILYWVGNNTMAKNLSPIVTSGRTVNKLSLASKRGFISQSGENEYFIAWRTRKGLYGTILNYDGSVQNESIPIYTSSTVSRNMLAAGYGEVQEDENDYGYFVVVYAPGTNKDLRYAVLDENGDIKSSGVLWEPDDPNYNLTTVSRRVAFDGEYFGVAFRVSEESGDYIYVNVFNLTASGRIDKNYTARLESPANTTGRIPIVGKGKGFIMAYYKGSKWYTAAVNINNGISFGSANDVTPAGISSPSSGGSLDLVWNTSGIIQYIAMTYPNGNGQLVVEKLYLNGSYAGQYWTLSGSGPYNYPFVAVKPMHSPEAFILLWKTGSSGNWTASEYILQDSSLTEVSPENQVPFFGNAVSAFLPAIGTALLYRKR
ncbi:hypothetical protein [Thermococcus sp.]|uniref:hypothetical protein n=1 Tax=Thermococcus sp. TaxID=35749 RepID=UPI002607071E|nr:hypothetical protein [Thermococcus sp.]